MKKQTMVKSLYGVAGVALITALVAGCGTVPGNGGTGGTSGSSGANQSASQSSTSNEKVTIAYVDWAEDVATSYLWKDILTNKGYNVTLKSMGDAGPLFTGLSEGGLDVFFDTWLPDTHKVYMKRYGSHLTDLGKWYQGQTNEGYVVPDYVTDVKSIGDLESHASEFGGQIIGIDPGAGEMALAAQADTTYGLTNMQLVQSSSPAMLSQLAKDYKEKKPIVVTLWSPHWAFTKYKLHYLSDPKNVFGKPGWIQTEANKKWAQNNPTIAGYLRNFTMSPNQLGSLEEDINAASSTDAGVQKWMKANQTLIHSWLK